MCMLMASTVCEPDRPLARDSWLLHSGMPYSKGSCHMSSCLLYMNHTTHLSRSRTGWRYLGRPLPRSALAGLTCAANAVPHSICPQPVPMHQHHPRHGPYAARAGRLPGCRELARQGNPLGASMGLMGCRKHSRDTREPHCSSLTSTPTIIQSSFHQSNIQDKACRSHQHLSYLHMCKGNMYMQTCTCTVCGWCCVVCCVCSAHPPLHAALQAHSI